MFEPPLATDWYIFEYNNLPCPVCKKNPFYMPTWHSESLSMYVDACEPCMTPFILRKVETNE